MDDRKRAADKAANDDYKGLEEATAGWDPYISDLLTDPAKGFREERRQEDRDKPASRRRSQLMNEDDDEKSE
ncbi:MAG: hypothetical protein QNJ73_00570 [Gammaproteobacteria bacterium]|nr:hypothetical protein [Gammaproteobacteria bacterium]